MIVPFTAIIFRPQAITRTNMVVAHLWYAFSPQSYYGGCLSPGWFDYDIVLMIQHTYRITSTRTTISREVWGGQTSYIGVFITDRFVFSPQQQRSVWWPFALKWRYNERNGVSNQKPHDCLRNRWFRCRSKKTSKPRVTGFCAGNSRWPVNSQHKGPVTRKVFPFDDVSMCFTDDVSPRSTGIDIV